MKSNLDEDNTDENDPRVATIWNRWSKLWEWTDNLIETKSPNERHFPGCVRAK